MPRETINDPKGSYTVQVGWHADQGVQLGVSEPEGRSLFWVMLGSNPKDLAAVGALVRSFHTHITVTGEDDEELGRQLLNGLDTLNVVVFQSLWSDLDRGRCNRLIRLLRKARDAAFGRDE